MTNYNLYGDFRQRYKDIESKDNVWLGVALTFLYSIGYITLEECQSVKSERIVEIRCITAFKEVTVELFFDNYEWSISLNVSYDLKVSDFKVEVYEDIK